MPSLPRHHSIAPHPLRVAVTELHVVGCDCEVCDLYSSDVGDALSMRHAAALATIGFFVATAIALVIDPAGTFGIIVGLLRWWLL